MGKIIIGTIGKEDIFKAIRKGSREADYEFNVGWSAKTKPHKNKKRYNRETSQSWKRDWDVYLKMGHLYIILYLEQILYNKLHNKNYTCGNS